ncbi:TonB-dependent receptor [Fulvitalea axinellae]|uniref:TonB-dependent receptor n=1 Tax=Fulvitalea axinellae TaxID=1182444 RepID=A0AAU9CI00_9BACT|nr:TonB-dependent receptor [Fulvitalea axinellae]
MKRIALIATLILMSLASYCQKITVKGSVKGQGADAEFYNVAILKPSDSSLVTGSAFSEAVFSLQVSPAKEYLLKVTSMGFLPVVKRIKAVGDLNVGEMVLVADVKELEAVTVKGKKASFTQKNGKLVMNIQGTTLSDAGTVFDALRRMPGIKVGTDDKVTIMGKGAPLIIVDGKEIRDNDELNRLQSDDIVSVEIDRNPSAKYDASVSSVLYITTKKKKKDHLSLQLNGRSNIGEKYSYGPGLKLNFRKGKISNYITYGYGDWNFKGGTTSHLINRFPEYSLESRTKGTWDNHNDGHRVFFGSTYDLPKGGSLQAQYSFSDYSNENTSHSTQTLATRDSEINRETHSDKDSEGRLHTVALIYEAKLDSLNTLTVSTDYSLKDNDAVSRIREGNVDYANKTQTRMLNDTEYSVVSGKVDYKGQVKGIGIEAGTKYFRTKNDGVTESRNPENGNVNFRNGNETLDQIYAGYVLADKSVGKWSFSAGVRYERTDTEVKLNGNTSLDTAYVGWYPSASVSYTWENEMALSLTYSRKINRPNFWSLNPSINYMDSLNYSQGDPTLSPTSIGTYNLMFSLPAGLSVFTEYKYLRNSIMHTAVNDPVNPEIVKHTPVNLYKTEYLSFGTNYNLSLDKFNLNASTQLEIPFIEVPYMDGIRKLKDPTWSLDFDADYSLSKRFQLLGGLYYRTRNVEDMTVFSEYWQANAGVQGKFLDDKLLVTVRLNDVFNSGKNHWLDKYGTIESGQRDKTNRRALFIYFRYNLNEFKNMFKDKSGGNDALRRL